MNTELIEKKFGEEEIRTRKGPRGKTLTYVTPQSVIRRLNEISDHEWGWTIKEWSKIGEEIMVLAHLEMDGIPKEDFGGSQITKSTSNGNPICIVDDIKAAASDALKRAARLFGIGLHIWEDEDQKPSFPVTNKSEEKITEEQLAAIKQLREQQLNWTQEQLLSRAKNLFAPKDKNQFTADDLLNLNPTMADALIKNLEKQAADKEQADQAPF